MPASRYLDPNIISKFTNLSFLPRGAVEGTVTGLHRSPYKGSSVEFSEHRKKGDGFIYLTIKRQKDNAKICQACSCECNISYYS